MEAADSAVNIPAKASTVTKPRRRKRRRSRPSSQSPLHQRAKTESTHSASMTATDPSNENSPPAILSEAVSAASEVIPGSKEMDNPKVADEEGGIDDATFENIIAALDASMEKDDDNVTQEPSDKDKDVAMTDVPKVEMSSPKKEESISEIEMSNTEDVKTPTPIKEEIAVPKPDIEMSDTTEITKSLDPASPSKAAETPTKTKGAKKNKGKQGTTTKDAAPTKGEAWVAPNGDYYSPEQLKAYADGRVKNEKGDKIFFRPEFVEDDPWAGMTPVAIPRMPKPYRPGAQK